MITDETNHSLNKSVATSVPWWAEALDQHKVNERLSLVIHPPSVTLPPIIDCQDGRHDGSPKAKPTCKPCLLHVSGRDMDQSRACTSGQMFLIHCTCLPSRKTSNKHVWGRGSFSAAPINCIGSQWPRQVGLDLFSLGLRRVRKGK